MENKKANNELLKKAIESNNTVLINGEEVKKSKEIDKRKYIENAPVGIFVAFRVYFKSKKGLKLTKVISGRVVENLVSEEVMLIETKNKAQYYVPYDLVVWVRYSSRWVRDVFNEMKKGAVIVDEDEDFKLIETVNEAIKPEEENDKTYEWK